MKIRRRIFAVLLVVAAPLLLFTSMNAPAKSPDYLAFIGTYTTKTNSKGIYAFRFDTSSGQLTPVGLAAETGDPSFLAISKNEKFLYAVNEVGNFEGKKSGGVTAFALDHKTGKLTQLNQVASGGADPCYVSLDQSGKYVLVANYTGGNVSAFPLGADGKLRAASSFIQHSGTGPNKERQEGPHAHYIAASSDNKFVFAVDLGLDEVLIYRFDAAKGTLSASEPPFAKVEAGSGPRHLAIAPNQKFAYVVNELKSTVTAFAFDAKKGTFSVLQTLSTLPKDFSGNNDTAEIVVHPSGKFVYASNRGHDSIAVFSIDQAKGTLTYTGDFSVKGKTPRNFALDPSGNFLLAANQESNNIVVFRIDRATGALTATGQVVDAPAPVDIVFARAE
jgi:6-phosphogluconolactonase